MITFLSRHHTLFNQVTQRLFTHQIKPKMNQALKPPEGVYLMTDLQKYAFEKVVKVPVVSLGDIRVSSVLPLVKKFLFKVDNFKPINHVDKEHVFVYLNPEVVQEWADLPEDVRNQLETLKLSEGHFKMEDLTLKYENFSAEAILRAVLPKDKEGVASFTKVGHIVHVNLREHLLPYKNVIGQVLFDKVKGCKSVVNKVNNIDNTYRNFQMEILKGDSNMHTTLKENNCKFEFDFSTVYWNSRLSTEHERIVNNLKKNDVFFDVFAGVGPFSIPAAKKKCKVFANDLNPEAYKWLMHNKKLNKILDENFSGFNLDGRDFISKVIKDNLPKYFVDHDVVIAMNLPALAVEFLDCYIGLLNNCSIPEEFKPLKLYIYCFAKGENPEEIAKKLIHDNLKVKDVDIDRKITNIFRVRTVSSMKEMVRVTLSLDRDILVGAASDKRQLIDDPDNNVQSLKKLCTKVHIDGNGQEQEQEQEEGEKCFQNGGSQELENESQGQSC